MTDTQTREWTKGNQTKRIKEWLKSGKSLTSMQAFEMWGCTRLSDKVFRLRKKGMDIDTVMVDTVTRFGDPCKYAKYIFKNPE